MEELFEVLCWGYLGLHPKPIGLLNVDGYYDHLIAFIEPVRRRRVSAMPRVRDLLIVDDDATAPRRPTVAAARRQWGVEPRRCGSR